MLRYVNKIATHEICHNCYFQYQETPEILCKISGYSNNSICQETYIKYMKDKLPCADFEPKKKIIFYSA